MKQFQQACVSGFILNNKGEVLMVKRADNDDFLPGLWEMPGGGTDFGEHPIQALKREIKEEVGVDVEVGKVCFVDDYFMEKDDEKIHRVELFYKCKLKNNDTEVRLSHEHSAYKWLSEENLKSLEMTAYMTKAVHKCIGSISLY
ncbi:MAG TPA: NUDIX hydrolase [Candidatus Saccharimonadales bacterium]|nr:NUDIX hydrolase [Candidatus Saccharimonadales bacterium]